MQKHTLCGISSHESHWSGCYNIWKYQNVSKSGSLPFHSLDSSQLFLFDSNWSPFLCLCNWSLASSPFVSDWSVFSPRSSRAGADAANSWHSASAERGGPARPATGEASVAAAGYETESRWFKYGTGCHCHVLFAALDKKNVASDEVRCAHNPCQQSCDLVSPRICFIIENTLNTRHKYEHIITLLSSFLRWCLHMSVKDGESRSPFLNYCLKWILRVSRRNWMVGKEENEAVCRGPAHNCRPKRGEWMRLFFKRTHFIQILFRLCFLNLWSLFLLVL